MVTKTDIFLGYKSSKISYVCKELIRRDLFQSYPQLCLVVSVVSDLLLHSSRNAAKTDKEERESAR